MKKALLFCLFSMLAPYAFSQTCTIAGSGTVNWDAATCQETGAAPASGASVIIPSGLIVQFTTNDEVPEHNGDITIFGKMEVNKSDVYIYGNVRVKTGGELEINEKLRIGENAPNCGRVLVVETGGVVEFPGTGSNDKLFICDNEIARAGGGGCAAYPAGPPPYCEPIGGFTGPTGFDEDGYDASLPVTLLLFQVSAKPEGEVALEWATGSEENFREFIVERSNDGAEFSGIGIVPGQGQNIYDLTTHYSFEDRNPLLGFNYYRLKAVDLDETFEYFQVRSVRVTGRKAVTAQPNPARGENVFLSTNFAPVEGDRIRLSNAFGVELLNAAVTSAVSQIPTENLTPGVYFLRYSGTAHSQTVRLIVH